MIKKLLAILFFAIGAMSVYFFGISIINSIIYTSIFSIHYIPFLLLFTISAFVAGVYFIVQGRLLWINSHSKRVSATLSILIFITFVLFIFAIITGYRSPVGF